MNLNKDPESWRRVSVDDVMPGSKAKGESVLRMAIEDIPRLADELRDVIAQARQILIHARVSEESAEHVLLPRYLVGALRDALTQLDR